MHRIFKIVPVLLVLPILLTGCETEEMFAQAEGIIAKVGQMLGKKQAGPGAAAMMGRVTRVTLVEMKHQRADIERELTGRTKAYRWAEVRPEVSGILRERCFTEGSLVKEGDVLYRIEPDTYQAALDNAKANLAGAEANLNVSRLRERRTADMLRSKSVSQQDYDDAAAALKQAQANVLAARAAVRTAEINLRRTEVHAPISGRIGKSTYTPGALLSVGMPTPLATIYQTDPIYVELSQSSDDLYALRKQLGKKQELQNAKLVDIKATLTMADGSYYPSAGHLNFSGIDVDQTTNTILLRAEFPNPEGELLPGLFVRTKVIMGEDEESILAPMKAVLRDAKGDPYVYLVKDGKADRRFIKVGHAIGNDWYVIDGLKAGDKIILDGVNNVRAGAPVQVVEAPADKPAAQDGGSK